MDQHARRLEHRTTTMCAWNVELSAIRRAKILASRESGCRVALSRQVVRCHPMETLEHLDADSETDAIQPVQNVMPNVRQVVSEIALGSTGIDRYIYRTSE